jgi:ribosomal protein L11 methyltransferase
MSEQNELLHCVLIESTIADSQVLEEILACLEIANQSIWTSADLDHADTWVYSDTAEDAAVLLARIEEILPCWAELLAGDGVKPKLVTLKREDWAESWKRHFHPRRVSNRFVVKPTWETYESAPGDVILEIDPGMSFGTGQHGTTQACLQMIDDLAAQLGPVPFLDAGCGSGILSLAAWKVGFRPVVAFDYDAQAVEIARENLTHVGCTQVAFSQADVAEFAPAEKFRLVVANILAPVLLKNAERLVSFLDAGQAPSYLLLSGILIEQYNEVRGRFEDLGLREIEVKTLKEWRSGCFVLG